MIFVFLFLTYFTLYDNLSFQSGLPFPPSDLPDRGIESVCLNSSALAGVFFITRATWEALRYDRFRFFFFFSFIPNNIAVLWFWKVLVQFSSVTQSCPTLCDPMNRRMPGLPVHHQLLEFTQTHLHRVGDAIQPSHPLSFPSPSPNPSQHQGLFK